MTRKRRRVLEGGTLQTEFLAGTIVSRVASLSRRAEDTDIDKLSGTAARESYIQRFQGMVFDGWGLENVAASLSNSVLNRFGNAWQQTLYLPSAGSVTGLAVYVSEARTGGRCDVEVFIGGSASGLIASLDGDGPRSILETAESGEIVVEPGQAITLRVSTTSGWTPTSADLTAWVMVDLDI